MANRRRSPSQLVRVSQEFADYLKSRAEREQKTVVDLTRDLAKTLRQKGRAWNVPASA